jgi:CheY-like chemotaxis protein
LETQTLRPLRVLVADDSEDCRESLGLLLRAWGHEVRLAHDSPSALQAYRCFCPDAVLLDIGLPGMSGWELACQIRAQGGHHALLVALTGYSRNRTGCAPARRASTSTWSSPPTRRRSGGFWLAPGKQSTER